ncbi:MAG TPA: hypothetical protein VLA19_06615 [Herpetosiphonaceae bacterium]|nr:hypothetical protein [Herpetosiphonaceae bacterium]
MANASVAQSINREHVGQALRRWRQALQYQPRELTALNKAALNLEACPWFMDTTSGELVIESATEIGRTRYHVSAEGCACKAAQHNRPCWHVWAYRIMHTASVLAQRAAAATSGTCPMCGAAIVGRQYYVGGRGYVYFDICSGDGSHFSRPA